MEYGKIRTDGSIQNMGNPIFLTIANPSEDQKEVVAQLGGWLEKVYTPQPECDTETQYLQEIWVEENGKAVQHWEVFDLEIEVEE